MDGYPQQDSIFQDSTCENENVERNFSTLGSVSTKNKFGYLSHAYTGHISQFLTKHIQALYLLEDEALSGNFITYFYYLFTYINIIFVILLICIIYYLFPHVE